MIKESTCQRRKKVLMADVTNLRTDSRLLRQSSTLAEAGYEVVLLGYNRNGVDVYRETKTNGVIFWELPYAKPKAKSQFVYNMLAILREIGLLMSMYWRVLLTKADVYHAHNIYSLPVMWLSARLRGAKLVYDSHELFCEWRKNGPYSGGKQWMLNRFIDLEHILCRRADAVICVSTGIQKILSRIHKIKKPVVIENFPSRREILEEPTTGQLRKYLGLPPDGKIVIFSGGFYRAIRLDNLVRIAPSFPKATFVLMGFDSLGYKEQLEKLCQEIGAGNVIFMNPVPSQEVVAFLRDADVAVHLYSGNLLMLKYCSSNKIFQYLAAGLRIVCSNDLHSVRQATDGYNVCFWVDPGDTRDLERGLRNCLSLSSEEVAEVRKMAQLCVEERCCWELQEDKLLDLYGRL